MNLRLGRIVLAAIAAEVLGILALVILFGAPTSATTPFALRLGVWIGPILAFVLCCLGGYWVARGAATHKLQNGIATGAVAAILGLIIAAVFAGPFGPRLLVSILGRVAGGTIGGWLAARRAHCES